MRKNVLLLAFCLVVTASSWAQTKIKFTEFDLPNGLHVILNEDHSTPIVAVSVLYHVGSKNEDPTRTGFAHFFEHLLFEGSENIKRGEFDEYIEGSGGMNNANTSMDRTYYYEIMPSNQMELALWLESERMLHAKVENIGIETQRQVVKEERRLRIDNRPYGRLVEEVMSRAFTTHPYKWPVIGSMAHLDAAEEKDYVNFYKTYYVPNNACLSISGDLDPVATKAAIIKYFGDIPKGAPITRPNIVEPALTKEVRDSVTDNIQLPAVVHAYRIPRQGTDDFYALDILGRILTGGESSRMYKSVVDNAQKAVAVASFPFNLEDPGVMLFYGIAASGVSAGELEAEMQKEYVRIKSQKVDDKELQKIKNQLESELISNYAGVDGRAEALANYYVYFGDANLINTEIQRYLKVTKEDIDRVAKQYLVDNNRVALHWLPKN